MEPPPDCSSCYMKNDDYNNVSVNPVQKKKNGAEKEDYLDVSSTVASSSSSEKASQVRSTAIVAYSASENKSMLYSRLKPETNLNLAPSNWLRKTVGLRPEIVLPGGRFSPSPNRPSGFNIALSHLNCVGKVDVVSDAENIKKLLKMPYSKAHISMAIHRIGKTLLLENFDIKKFTAEESEWQWFRNFYQKLVPQPGNNILSEKKKKSPESQYDRLMLSKFLYLSIYKESFKELADESGNSGFQDRSDGERFENDDEDTDDSEPKLVEIDEKEESSSDSVNDSSSISPQPPVVEKKEDTSGAVVLSEKRWRYWIPEDCFQTEASDAFERNISWTFEDLQMMLGTNMPIFGGGRYPAVSLRLRDSNKPINILTGIDYWLDNLICNVPELVMCFHVNGIVQNYEVIKTEDIPKLEHSSFSPHVVKDIAQNILSFLKSNCTKEGHTYWLFKGSGDDVVKLYDLTTLCHSTTDKEFENQNKIHNKNPYIFSVAMLLYKTAISLMQSRDPCDHRTTVKKLLGQCIDLLDHNRFRYTVTSAICILSTLCLPDPGLDKPAREKTDSPKENDGSPGSTDWKSCETCTAHHNAELMNQRKNNEGSRKEEVASIPSVTDLSIPDRYQPISASFDLIKSPPSRAKKHQGAEAAGQVEESCYTAISHVVSALGLLVFDMKSENWQQGLARQVTRNAALAYFRLAEQASDLGKLGRALRRGRLALQSYETFVYLSTYDLQNPGSNPEQESTRPSDFPLLLPRLLSLCGEVQFSVVEDIRAHGAVSSSNIEEFTSFTKDDAKIKGYISQVLPGDGKYYDLTKLSSEIDQSLQSCERCYRTGLRILDELCPPKKEPETTPSHSTKQGAKEGKSKGKGKSKRSSTDSPSVPVEKTPEQKQADLIFSLRMILIRRHGHVINELGAYALNRAVELLSDDSAKDNQNQDLWDAWNEASAYFEQAQLIFLRVNDVTNQALVLSNMGRLMRVKTQFYSNNEEGQLSKQERECYAVAIEKYQKALALMGPKDPKKGCPPRLETGVATCTSVYDNISWELSSSYFSMAQIMQDHAPQDIRASEEAEKEVTSLMNNSLKYCKDIWENTPKQTIALYRQSKIYYRMASLHHNSYRNCSDAHKCKQLRNLAEKHYMKSLTLLEGLEHPNEIIHVQLERLSMKDHHITSVSSPGQKVKLLLEGLEMFCNCIKPLQMVDKTTKLATKSFTSQVDSREQASSTETDIEEITKLLRILATILQSFLLQLVKISPSTGLFEKEYSSLFKKKRFQGKSAQQIFKEMYSKSLRELQILYEEIGEEKYKSFQRNVTTALDVLNDIAELTSK